jgi:MerR family transcriptional regulator, thiopeptide resistance regulator
MIDSISINEVVHRTGLTSRTLRYYEMRGLLRPLRTASGRRIFGTGELERIQQIVALKKAGLSLIQIASVIDRKPVNLASLIEGQLAALDEEARKLDSARRRLSALLARIKTGESIDVTTLCALIRETDCMADDAKWMAVIDRFYTPEEQEDWLANVKPQLDNFMDEDYHARWRDLVARIEAALPLDPESDAALGFVREWYAQLEPFSRIATPQMWQSTRNFYQQLSESDVGELPGFSPKAWLFISSAADKARAKGYDLGLLPQWMR